MDQARLDRACFTIQIRLDYNLLAVNIGFFLQAAHIDGQNYFYNNQVQNQGGQEKVQ